MGSLGKKVDVLLLNEAWFGNLFRRDVLILCDNLPSWYGRTIMPYNTYQSRSTLFQDLRSKPIGSILYNDPMIDFKRRHIFQIKENSLKYNKHNSCQLDKSNLLWTRASTFHIDNLPIFLIEIFLPEFYKEVRFYE